MTSIEGLEKRVLDLTTQGTPVSIAAVCIQPSSPDKSLQSSLHLAVENGSVLLGDFNVKAVFNDQCHSPNTLDKAFDALFPDQPAFSRTSAYHTYAAVFTGALTGDPAVSLLLLGVIDDFDSDHCPVFFHIFPPAPIQPLFIAPVLDSFKLARVMETLFLEHMESHKVPFWDPTFPEELDTLSLLAETFILLLSNPALLRSKHTADFFPTGTLNSVLLGRQRSRQRRDAIPPGIGF
jgi:hypothetical protein